MKKKLQLQDIAEAVSLRENISRREAETFMRALFDTVEQALLDDKFIKIKGLGTFKLIAVSERESININTGERFQISGHTKISFTPDNAMKELVNRPFAHFEAVDLNEDTNPEEFEIIDRETENEYSMEDEEDNEETAETTPEDSVSEKEIVDESTTSIGKAEEVDNVAIEEQNTVLESPNTSSENTTQEQQTTTTPNENDKSVETNDKEVADNHTNADEKTEKSEITPEVFAPSSNNSDEAHTPSEHTSSTAGYAYIESMQRRKPNIWKYVALSLIVLILMSISYFVGYYRLLCPCSYPVIERLFEPSAPDNSVRSEAQTNTAKPTENKVEKELPALKSNEPIKIDSTLVGTNAETSNQSSTKQEKAEQKAQEPTIPPYHIVKRGENVYRISRKYYKTDKYVPQIIRENKLKDSDNITVGMKLKLPQVD